jgi:hypothetical protein
MAYFEGNINLKIVVQKWPSNSIILIFNSFNMACRAPHNKTNTIQYIKLSILVVGKLCIVKNNSKVHTLCTIIL